MLRDTWTSTWTRVHGIHIHARAARGRSGQRTVVLVHGLLVSSRYMTPLAERLRDDFDVWGPDMPGFGLSDDPPGVPDVASLGRWLGRWLEQRGLEDVILVANSFGCQYAVDLLARGEPRVSALLLAGPTIDPAHRTASRAGARWLANAPVDRLSLGLIIVRDLVDCGLRRAAITYKHALRDAIELKLPRVEVPTIVSRGSRDPLVTQRWAEEATALSPNARLRVIPKAGHTITYNSPDVVAELVKELA